MCGGLILSSYGAQIVLDPNQVKFGNLLFPCFIGVGNHLQQPKAGESPWSWLRWPSIEVVKGLMADEKTEYRGLRSIPLSPWVYMRSENVMSYLPQGSRNVIILAHSMINYDNGIGRIESLEGFGLAGYFHQPLSGETKTQQRYNRETKQWETWNPSSRYLENQIYLNSHYPKPYRLSLLTKDVGNGRRDLIRLPLSWDVGFEGNGQTKTVREHLEYWTNVYFDFLGIRAEEKKVTRPRRRAPKAVHQK